MKGLTRVMRVINYYFKNAHENFTILKDDYDTVLFSLIKTISLVSYRQIIYTYSKAKDYNPYLLTELEEEIVNLFDIMVNILKKDANNKDLKTIANQVFIFLLEPRYFNLSNSSLLVSIL